MSLPSKILGIMEQNPKFKYNVKAMYTTLFFKPDTPVDKKLLAQIRTTMNRLYKHGKIRQHARGFYQIKPSPKIIQKLETPDIKVHGVKIEYRLSENNIFGIHGITAQHNIIGFLDANRFEEVCNGEGVSLKRFSKNVWWEDRKITFTIHDCGLIEVFCSAGNNCMSLSDFYRFSDFISGFLNPICKFEKNKAMLRQIGLNRDFEEQQLEGVSCITLKRFLNDWCRVYQHDDVVRYEHHLKLDISLEDAFNSLSLLTFVPRNGNGVDNSEGMFR